MQLNEDAARAIMMLRASNEDALKHLMEFFAETATASVRSAASCPTNHALQNQYLGHWQVYDTLSRMDEVAEAWRRAKK